MKNGLVDTRGGERVNRHATFACALLAALFPCQTLAQVKAARPTLDYDGRYGSPDAFIEAVYRGLGR